MGERLAGPGYRLLNPLENLWNPSTCASPERISVDNGRAKSWQPDALRPPDLANKLPDGNPACLFNLYIPEVTWLFYAGCYVSSKKRQQFRLFRTSSVVVIHR